MFDSLYQDGLTVSITRVTRESEAVRRAALIAPTMLVRTGVASGLVVLLIAALFGSRVIEVPVTQARVSSDLSRSDFAAVSRFVFVPSRNAPLVTVIDQSSDQVVGKIDPGLVPDQIIVSDAARKLAAIDGATTRLSLVDLSGGQPIIIDLDFIPQRVIAAVDGHLIAVAGLEAGKVAFIELMRARIVSTVTGLSRIRDYMFGADGAFLYVAADALNGIGVVDVGRGKLIEDIHLPELRSAGVSGLTRAPSGRTGYVKSRNGGAQLVDLSNFRAIRAIDVPRGDTKVFPTGYGGYLIVPDNGERRVTVMAAGSLTVAAMLKGSSDMTTVYSGWFDTTILVPSKSDRRLLIYDLEHLVVAGDISLPGRPVLGAVTADGAKFYLAMEDAASIGVFIPPVHGSTAGTSG